MNPLVPCTHCGCAQASSAHAVLDALRIDDVDAAIELGLLDALPCAGCRDNCNARLLQARDERRFALAARDRHRARAARLQRRAAEREARRAPPAGAVTTSTPALPAAAAAALARAKAKAAARDRS